VSADGFPSLGCLAEEKKNFYPFYEHTYCANSKKIVRKPNKIFCSGFPSLHVTGFSPMSNPHWMQEKSAKTLMSLAAFFQNNPYSHRRLS
jgi:hypothetical protein